MFGMAGRDGAIVALDEHQPDDTGVIARQFDRIAARYDQHDEVPGQIASRLLERLDYLALTPATVLDLGCGTGKGLEALRLRYRKARLLGIDASPCMLELAAGRFGWWRPPSLILSDAHQLPLPADSVDLVVSSLMLPWCRDPHAVFQEIHRVLKPGGAVLFSSCGPDTFIEYRLLPANALVGVNTFGLVDMHDLGDSMLSTGFSAPVLDRENLTVSYPSVRAFEAELRALGGANVATGRRRGLMRGPDRKGSEERMAGQERFSVTIEIVQGHGWKHETVSGGKTADGDFVISLDQFRRKASNKKSS